MRDKHRFDRLYVDTLFGGDLKRAVPKATLACRVGKNTPLERMRKKFPVVVGERGEERKIYAPPQTV
jgi:hypothetical protein